MYIRSGFSLPVKEAVVNVHIMSGQKLKMVKFFKYLGFIWAVDIDHYFAMRIVWKMKANQQSQLLI